MDLYLCAIWWLGVIVIPALVVCAFLIDVFWMRIR